MNEQMFKDRTRRFRLQVIKLVGALPRSRTADVIGRQWLGSGTSVGANYCAACRGKSAADVLATLAIVEEEADESVHWMEVLVDAEMLPPHRTVKSSLWGLHSSKPCEAGNDQSKNQNSKI